MKVTLDSMVRVTELTHDQEATMLAPLEAIYKEFADTLSAGAIGGVDSGVVTLPRGMAELLGSLPPCEISDGRQYGDDIQIAVDRSKLDPDKLKYQVRAIELAAPQGEGVLVSPTGTGKTVMEALLVEELGVNTLILTHTSKIASQIVSTFKELAGIDTGFIGGGARKIKPITVGLIQSVRSYDPILKSVGLLIIDEAHHVSASSYLSVLRECTARCRFGFTATIRKSDFSEKVIYAALGQKLVDIGVGELQDKGFLNRGVVETVYTGAIATRFDYVRQRCWYFKSAEKTGEKKCPHPCTYPKDDDTDKCVYDKGYYTWVYKKLADDQLRNELLIARILEKRMEHPWTIVLTHLKAHAKLIAEKLVAAGADTVYLAYGSPMSQKVRDASVASYVSSGGTLVCTTGGLGEGFDAPKTSCLVRAMPSGGKVSVRQQTGRIMRPQERESVIVDFVDPKIPWLKKLWMGRLSIYKAIGFRLASQKKDDLFGGA